MPLYTYKHPETEECVDVIQGMNDKHTFVDEDGLKWNRVYHVPTAGFDTRLDPFSKKQFTNKTKDIKTYGDAWDISKEMSMERAEKTGQEDKVKAVAEKKFYMDKQKRMKRK